MWIMGRDVPFPTRTEDRVWTMICMNCSKQRKISSHMRGGTWVRDPMLETSISSVSRSVTNLALELEFWCRRTWILSTKTNRGESTVTCVALSVPFSRSITAGWNPLFWEVNSFLVWGVLLDLCCSCGWEKQPDAKKVVLALVMRILFSKECSMSSNSVCFGIGGQNIIVVNIW